MSRRLWVPTQRPPADPGPAVVTDSVAAGPVDVAPAGQAGPWRIALFRRHLGPIPLPAWGGYLSLCEAAPGHSECTLPLDQQVASIEWRSTPAAVAAELEAIAVDLDAAHAAGADPAAGRWWWWAWQVLATGTAGVLVTNAVAVVVRWIEAVTR